MKGPKLKVYLASLWLILTTSLIVWWMYFALGLVSQQGAESIRHQNMLLLEGVTLLTLLVVGGGTLIYLILQQGRQADIMRNFFAAFSHDMKTAVASLRLQTESLEQDLEGNKNTQPILKRLIADTSRILVATDNSLYFAQSGNTKLLKEDIELSDLLNSMKASWPQLNITINGEAWVKADRRALYTIFENILHNSVAHGKATDIHFVFKPEQNRVQIHIKDNGSGFSGDVHSLGLKFIRHTNTSGSGLGLNIVKGLLSSMSGGDLSFKSHNSGFEVAFSLPGSER